MIVRSIYITVLVLFAIYSYALVDPNITFINHPVWTGFREVMVQLGYHNRQLSWYIYLAFVLVLGILHFMLMKSKDEKPIRLAIITGLILSAGYPLLTHDFFNYMFYGKTVTVYGQNPYFAAPMDFPDDQWLRFMHWTHANYGYGPLYLIIPVVTSFMSFGSFLIHYVLMRLVTAAAFIASVWFLDRIDRKYALFFATNPFILIEGVLNAHNEIIAVVLGVAGAYYVLKDRQIIGRITLVLSAAIKYMTLPFIILSSNKKAPQNLLAAAGFVVIIGYFLVAREVQPWYFLNCAVLLPYFFREIRLTYIFQLGLLMSYYPFIRHGHWIRVEEYALKDIIMAAFLAANLVFIVFVVLKNRRGAHS